MKKKGLRRDGRLRKGCRFAKGGRIVCKATRRRALRGLTPTRVSYARSWRQKLRRCVVKCERRRSGVDICVTKCVTQAMDSRRRAGARRKREMQPWNIN